MKYILNGELLQHVGHNGISECFYFTKVVQGRITLVEVPYSFDGQIMPESD